MQLLKPSLVFQEKRGVFSLKVSFWVGTVFGLLAVYGFAFLVQHLAHLEFRLLFSDFMQMGLVFILVVSCWLGSFGYRLHCYKCFSVLPIQVWWFLLMNNRQLSQMMRLLLINSIKHSNLLHSRFASLLHNTTALFFHFRLCTHTLHRCHYCFILGDVVFYLYGKIWF